MELENKNCPLQPKATFPLHKGVQLNGQFWAESIKLRKSENRPVQKSSLMLKGNATEGYI